MNGGGIPPKPTIIDITSEFDSSGWEFGHYIYARENGTYPLGENRTTSQTLNASSGFVNIEAYKKLTITVLQLENPESNSGACFYDASRNAIQGILYTGDSPIGMIEKEIVIPPGASYIRTTKRTGEGFGPFTCLAE